MKPRALLPHEHLADALREAVAALEAMIDQGQHSAVGLPDPDDGLLAPAAGQIGRIVPPVP